MDDLTIRNCVFAYKCSAKWEDLDCTDDENTRFCQDCQREVHLCEDDEVLAVSVKLNRCVAFYRDGSGPDSGMLMGDISFPFKEK